MSALAERLLSLLRKSKMEPLRYKTAILLHTLGISCAILFSLSLSQDPALGGRGGVASSSSAAAQPGAQDDIATIFKVIC